MTNSPIQLLYGPEPPSYPQVTIEIQITLLHAVAIIIAFAFMVIFRFVSQSLESNEMVEGKELMEKTKKSSAKCTVNPSFSNLQKFSLRRTLEKRSSRRAVPYKNTSRSPSPRMYKSGRMRSVSPARTVTLRSSSTKLKDYYL